MHTYEARNVWLQGHSYVNTHVRLCGEKNCWVCVGLGCLIPFEKRKFKIHHPNHYMKADEHIVSPLAECSDSVGGQSEGYYVESKEFVK